MKGLLKHPPIVLELLQCITPLDYMMLRRVFPIFMRDPQLYPSVEEMGFADFPHCYWTGVPVLMVLYGIYDHHLAANLYHETAPISGVSYNHANNRLRIRDLEAVRLGTFTVDVFDYTIQHFSAHRYPADGMVNMIYKELNEYRKYGFHLVLKFCGRASKHNNMRGYCEQVAIRVIAKWNEGSF